MPPSELQEAIRQLTSDVAVLRQELTQLRQDIAPMLKWKTGLASLFAIIVAIGVVARAVDYIVQFFHEMR